jgi:hypothetical protein
MEKETPRFSSSPLWPGFSMTFKNGWEISVQFGNGHYCSNKMKDSSSRQSETAEVAIFAPDKDGFPREWWSYDETLDDVVEQPEESFVNGWLTTDQVSSIINIIANKDENKSNSN